MSSGDLDPARLIDHPAAAGIAGAMLSLRFAPGATWGARAVNVIGGAAVAVYVGPMVAEMLQLSSNGARMGLGFGLGAFGVTLADVIVAALRDLQLAKIITDRLSGR